MRPGTSSDGDSLLLPPFHHFAFLILPSFPPLVYTAAPADAPSSASSRFESADGFTRWMIPNPKGDGGAIGEMAEFGIGVFA